MVSHSLFLSLLLSFATLQAIHAVEYNILNNDANSAGGQRFTNEVGIDYCRQTLDAATNFIWSTFQQNSPGDRRDVQQVTMIVESFKGVAYASNSQIHVSSDYIAGYSGDLRREITGILYHENTHNWQWNGNGQAPSGLIEGIADFVRLKAGYAPDNMVKPGEGDRWDQGYGVTARFLEYCDRLSNGFVAEMNKKMKDGYSDDYFVQLLGKPVSQLWQEYKASSGQ